METERPPQMGLPSVPNHEPGKDAATVLFCSFGLQWTRLDVSRVECNVH